MLELFHYTEREQKELLNSIIILCDTREHENKNDHILQYFDAKNINYKKQKLDHGDYTFMIPADEKLNIPRDLFFGNEICVERKANLSEWANNLVQDRAAIKKKFAIAPKNTVLVIENGTYADMVNGNYEGNYSPKSYWASFHSIWNEFNVPIIFMPDNKYTGLFILGFFHYYLRNIIK